MAVQSLSQDTITTRHRGIQRSERRLALALLLPSIIIILLVVGFPMLYSLYLSFTNFTLTSAGDVQFVGLQNYIDLLFDDPLFWTAF
jgi:multiple sugar transport system permease protein